MHRGIYEDLEIDADLLSRVKPIGEALCPAFESSRGDANTLAEQ